MQTLNYQGFTKQCSCKYGILDAGESKLVVFVQGPLTNTSITNMIEVLASRVLATDLLGTDPKTIRFFEYYSPDLQPLQVWQEVSFEEWNQLPAEGGLLSKLLELATGAASHRVWCVDKPSWRPLAAGSVPPAALQLVAAGSSGQSTA